MKSPHNHALSELIEFSLMLSTAVGPTGATKRYVLWSLLQMSYFLSKLSPPRDGPRRIHQLEAFARVQSGSTAVFSSSNWHMFSQWSRVESGSAHAVCLAFFWYSHNISREFQVIEVEHFVDPSDKSHPKFASVADQKANFFSVRNQIEGRGVEQLTFEQALKGVINLFKKCYLKNHFCRTLSTMRQWNISWRECIATC